jgi:competence protein ComEC
MRSAARLLRLRKLFTEWARAETVPGRLAVAFGGGIVLYFAADREPALWAGLALTGFALAIAYGAQKSVVGFPLELAFACASAGFAVATLNSARLAHPILHVPMSFAAALALLRPGLRADGKGHRLHDRRGGGWY